MREHTQLRRAARVTAGVRRPAMTDADLAAYFGRKFHCWLIRRGLKPEPISKSWLA